MMIARDYDIDPRILDDTYGTPCLIKFVEYIGREIEGYPGGITDKQREWVEFFAYGGMKKEDYFALPVEERRKATLELLGMAPRGWFKTTFVIMYITFYLYILPDSVIFYMSNNQTNCFEVVRGIMKYIDAVDFLRPLRESEAPNNGTVTYTRSEIKTKYASTKSPNLTTAVADGKFTGRRADIVFLDDLETEKACATPESREKLRNLYVAIDNLKTIGRDQKKVITGTTYHSDSFHYWLLTHEGSRFKGHILPACYPSPDNMEHYKGCLAPSVVREMNTDPSLGVDSMFIPTDPQVIKTEEMVRKFNHGKRSFSLNQMLNPFLQYESPYLLELHRLGLVRVKDVDHYFNPFRVSDHPHTRKKELTPFSPNSSYLHFIEPDTSYNIRYSYRYMFIDPSAGGEDECSVCIISICNGNFIIDYVHGFLDGTSNETFLHLVNIYNKYRPRMCFIEKNYGGGMYRKLFDNYIREQSIDKNIITGDYEVKNTRKEERINSIFSQLLSQNKLFITEQAVEGDLSRWARSEDIEKTFHLQYTFLYQYSHFYIPERGSALLHDDRLDVVHGGLTFMSKLLSEEKDVVKQQEQKALDDQYMLLCERFDKFMAYRLVYNKKHPDEGKPSKGKESRLPRLSKGSLSRLMKK